jgi:hypothetical protein
MSTSNQSQVVHCRLSVWILATLSILWTGISFHALSGLRAIEDWRSPGPMEWLCLLLIGIHIMLILSTVWVWARPKPEVLMMDARQGSERGFAVGFVIGFIGIWLSGRLDGWISNLAAVIGVLGFCAAAILMLRDIRAARKLARSITEDHESDS